MPAIDYNLGGIQKIVAGSARPSVIFRIHFSQAGIPPKRPLSKVLEQQKTVWIMNRH